VAYNVVTVGAGCVDVMVRPVESLPPRGKILLVPQLEMHLGGLAAVTAAVISQLGAQAAFIGRVGLDGFGDSMMAALKKVGVSLDLVQRTPTQRTSATVVLISEDGERTFLHQVGASADLTDTDVPVDYLGGTQVLHWGGPAVTPGLDGEPIGHVFAKARAAGIKTSMDTCYDAREIWFPHIEHALPHLDIVMSSYEEARHYTGEDEPEAMARFFRSFGVETVMIKLGARGVFAMNNAESHHIPAQRVEVVDTTGAGDAACGAFLFGYIQGWNLRRCAELANTVGAMTVQTMGGAEAVRSLDETLAMMEKAR